MAEQIDCLTQLHWAASSARCVVASGSLPPGVAPNFHQRVADLCRRDGNRLILDTSGTGIEHVSGVFLLKPDVSELGASVGHRLFTPPEQIAAARQIINRVCAQIILLSLGPDGALLITVETAQYYPPVAVQNGDGVGSGDAMVAAITVGLCRGWPLDKAVRPGIAAGAAMRLTPGTAPCRAPDVDRLFALVPDPVTVTEHTDTYDFVQQTIART